MNKTGLMLVGLLLLLLLQGGCDLSADFARTKAYTAYRAGDMGEARSYFETAVDKQATDWKSRYYLGRIGLDTMNDASYARRHLETCETIRHAQPDSMLTPRIGSSESFVPWPTRQQISDALAEAIFRQGHTARLHSYVRQQATDFGECDDYLRMGRYLAAINDPDGARSAYQMATMIADPDDARPHLAMAEFLDRVGDRPAALAELRKAFYIDPTLPGLADNIRTHGLVPGPTVGIAPERLKPQIVRRKQDEPTPPKYSGTPTQENGEPAPR